MKKPVMPRVVDFLKTSINGTVKQFFITECHQGAIMPDLTPAGIIWYRQLHGQGIARKMGKRLHETQSRSGYMANQATTILGAKFVLGTSWCFPICYSCGLGGHERRAVVIVCCVALFIALRMGCNPGYRIMAKKSHLFPCCDYTCGSRSFDVAQLASAE